MKKQSKGDMAVFLILLLWLPALALLLLLGSRAWQAAQKPLVRARVAMRLDDLEEQAARGQLAGEFSDGVLWCETAAFGLVPSSRYCGYCRSADGDPHPYPGMEDYDEVPVMFGFRWQEPGGDNGCYLEHIGGNFYYYEVWF